MMQKLFYLACLTALQGIANAQVVGKPYGFATGVTGGGSATPAIPKDINEYVHLRQA